MVEEGAKEVVEREILSGKDGDHGDGLAGFTIKGNTPYWTYLHKANALHLTRNQQYTMLLRHLHKDGVAFKDIRNRLINMAKKEGLYSPARGPWCESSDKDGLIPAYRPFNQLVKNNTAWAVALDNFTKWVGRNWSNYYEKKEKSTAPVVKTSQVLEIPQDDGTVKEIKVTIRGINDEQFEAWLDAMTKPVRELSFKEQEQIMLQNPDLLSTLYGNIAEEKGAVEEYNMLVDALGSPEQMVEVAPRGITPDIGEPSGQFIAQ